MGYYNFKEIVGAQPPDEWVYKYYAEVKEPMDGRTIKIFSLFNQERTPSMFLYVKGGRYLWKDHSSGKGGDCIDLVTQIFEDNGGEKVNYKIVMNTIRHDYEKWVAKNGKFTPTKIEIEHYMYDLVCDYTVKQYDNWDIKYWDEFGIETELLEKYNIGALKSYRIGKKAKSGFTKWGKLYELSHSYGFFLEDTTLIKIYNPLNIDFKHITLKNDILGREQLEDKSVLIIASSMKDLLVLKSLNLEIDVVAPIGEKVLINADDMEVLKGCYKHIFTLFDNDKTGVRAMMMYKSVYGLDYIYIPFFKDVAEFKASSVYSIVKDEITIAINKKVDYNERIKNEEKVSQPWRPIEIPGATNWCL